MQTHFSPIKKNRLEEDINILFIKSNRNAKYISHALHGKEMNFQDFKAKLCQLTRRKQEHYKQSQRGGRTGGRSHGGARKFLPTLRKIS